MSLTWQKRSSIACTLPGHALRDLDDLLEGRPVLPRDERLGDAAERPVPDRVEARLLAGTALVAAYAVRVQLRRVDRERLLQRALERPAAAPLRAAAAVDQRPARPDAPPQQ